MSLPLSVQAQVRINYDQPSHSLVIFDGKDLRYTFPRAVVEEPIKLRDQSFRLSYGHFAEEMPSPATPHDKGKEVKTGYNYRIIIYALEGNSNPIQFEAFGHPVKLSSNAMVTIAMGSDGEFWGITPGYVGTVEVQGTPLKPDELWTAPPPPPQPKPQPPTPKPVVPAQPVPVVVKPVPTAEPVPKPKPAPAVVEPVRAAEPAPKPKPAPAIVEPVRAAEPAPKPKPAPAPPEKKTPPAASQITPKPSLFQSFFVTPLVPRSDVPDTDAANTPAIPESDYVTVAPPPSLTPAILSLESAPTLEVLPPPPPPPPPSHEKTKSHESQTPSFTAVPATWPLCLVLEVTGNGTATTPSGKTVRLQAGQTLVQGVRLTMLADARARFYLSPGGMFELDANSIATLGNVRLSDKSATEQYGIAKTSLFLEKGIAIFNNFTEYKGAKSFLRVITPHGVLSAHETNFTAAVTADSTIVNVLDGALLAIDNSSLSNKITLKNMSIIRPYQRISFTVAAPTEILRTPVEEQRLTDRTYVQTAMMFLADRPELLALFRRIDWKTEPNDVEDQISMDQTARRSSWPGRIYESGLDQVDLSFDEVNRTL